MNHRPFEDWLLNDVQLTAAEKRELDAHLLTCKYCSALTETGFALRAARVHSPAAGFSLRFQERLVRHKIVERRRRFFGSLILIAVTLAVLTWIGEPLIRAMIIAPIPTFTRSMGNVLSVLVGIQALIEAVSVLVRVVPNVLPAYVWAANLAALTVLAYFWIRSSRRLVRAPQGVSA